MSLRQNAFVLLLVTVLAAIVGLWADPAADPQWWHLPAGVLLLGLSYELWACRGLHLEMRWDMAPRWILGRRVPMALIVSQAGPRTLAVEIAPDAPGTVAIDRAVRSLVIPGAEGARLDLTGIAHRLGPHEFPAIRIRVAGPFGLAWWPRQMRDPRRIDVVPEFIVDGGRAATGAMAGGGRQCASVGAGAQVLQLREYQSGDPLRVIDWKASARRRRLISRDFSEDQHLDILIGIDVGRTSALWCGDLDRLGHYANVAARFSQHVIGLDDRVGLVVFGDRPLAALPPARGTAAVGRIRRLLAAIRAQSTDSNPILAAARIRTLLHQRSLVILLTEVEDASSAGQLAGAMRLLRPKHLPFIAALTSAGADDFANATAHDWLDPYRALAGAEYRVRRDRNVRALQAQGVAAVVARPERLEGAVFGAYAEFQRRRRI